MRSEHREVVAIIQRTCRPISFGNVSGLASHNPRPGGGFAFNLMIATNKLLGPLRSGSSPNQQSSHHITPTASAECSQLKHQRNTPVKRISPVSACQSRLLRSTRPYDPKSIIVLVLGYYVLTTRNY